MEVRAKFIGDEEQVRLADFVHQSPSPFPRAQVVHTARQGDAQTEGR